MLYLTYGTAVKVQQWDGKYRWDKVIEYKEEIKNGQPGYSLESGHWCYIYQIVETKDK